MLDDARPIDHEGPPDVAVNGLLDPSFAAFRDQTRFWIQRVAVPLIMVVGLFGNLVTVIIMTRRRMRSTTNMYLAALAFVDMLYLVLTFLLGLSHYPNMAERKYYVYWHLRPFLMMLTDACSNTSVWLTVTFTIERFIAVRYPMQGKVWCTEARAQKLIACVFLFAILFALPVPFEWKVTEKQVTRPAIQGTPADAAPNPGAGTNRSLARTGADIANNELKIEGLQEDFIISLENSDFGSNETYKTIYYWSTAVIFYFIPLLSLTFFNGFLIHSVNRSRRERNKMTGYSSAGAVKRPSERNKGTLQLAGSTATQAAEQITRRPAYYANHCAQVEAPRRPARTCPEMERSDAGERRAVGIASKRERLVSNQRIRFDDSASLVVGSPAEQLNVTSEQQKVYTFCDNSNTTATGNKPTAPAVRCPDDNRCRRQEWRIASGDGATTGVNVSETRDAQQQRTTNGGAAAAVQWLDEVEEPREPVTRSDLSPDNTGRKDNGPAVDEARGGESAARVQLAAELAPVSQALVASSASGPNLAPASSQERRITVMLISVVILFLICQIPSAAMLLYTSVHETVPNTNEHALLLAFGNIFNFLMAVNAAGNFILYSFLSKKYRRTFVILFCKCAGRAANKELGARSSRPATNSSYYSTTQRQNFAQQPSVRLGRSTRDSYTVTTTTAAPRGSLRQAGETDCKRSRTTEFPLAERGHSANAERGRRDTLL